MPAISFGVGVKDNQIVIGRWHLRFVPPAASGQGRPGACEERAVEGRPGRHGVRWLNLAVATCWLG